MVELVYSVNEIDKVAETIIGEGKEHNVWLFKGDLGTGKTTLLKSIGKLLFIKDEVSSPSFSIVNEYQSELHKKIYHFDFYRMKDQSELTDIGWWDILEEDKLIWVEWPEMIPDYLPEPHLFVDLQHISAEKRHIIIK